MSLSAPKRLALIGCTFLVGIAIYVFLLPILLQTGWAVALKVSGRADHCDWARIARFYVDIDRFAGYYNEARESVVVIRSDPSLPLDLVESPYGPMWIQRTNATPGIGWLFAEHKWIGELGSRHSVRSGDTVLDVGAHVGVFVFEALERGAAKVIAVEPDPRNLECLRRNFEEQIASGQVEIVAAGAWSERGSISLHLGENSAWNSMTEVQGETTISVPVLPIDEIVAQLNLDSVDYLKMDIEGAEKEALRGARETLSNHRPRVAIDTYQWPYDLEELLALIREGDSGYQAHCGPCEPTVARDAVVPHITFYESPNS